MRSHNRPDSPQERYPSDSWHSPGAAVRDRSSARSSRPTPNERSRRPPTTSATSPATPATTSELRDLVDRFSQDRPAIQRFYTIQGSTTRRERLRTFYDAWLAKLPAVRFDALSLEGKVDYVLLRNRIEYERALLGREERVRRETGELVPFYDDVALMQEDRQRLVFVDADAAVTSVRGVAAKVEAARARVAGGLTRAAGRRRARGRAGGRAQHRPRAVVRVLQRLRPEVHRRGARVLSVAQGSADRLRRAAAREDRRPAARRRTAVGRRRRARRSRRRRRAADAVERRTDRRRSDRPRGSARGSARRDDRLHAGAAHRDRQSRVRLVRSRDEEGVARHGLRRRLDEGAREGQEHLRAARRTAAAGSQPRARGHRVHQAARPRHGPAARARPVAHDDDAGSEPARESVLPGRRDHPGLLSDQHDVRGRHADGDARQRSAFLARDRLPRADSRATRCRASWRRATTRSVSCSRRRF